MITSPQIKSERLTSVEKNPETYSLGLVIPFQPSIVDKNTIQGLLNYSIEVAQLKLERFHENIFIKQITRRLQRIFSNLNYNSHRKSVAIIIEGEEEKIIYLNYSGKPVFLFNDTFSLLDLVGNSIHSPEFELLVFKKDGAELYEYFNDSLHKVFSQTRNLCTEVASDSSCLIHRISNIIKRVNSKNDKPVFVFSEDEDQTDKFCEYFPFKEIAFKLNISSNEDLKSKIQLIVNKVINQWNYHQTKLVKGQIAIAKRNQTLHSHLDEVIRVLKHSDDGLLLIDRFMKDEIHKTSKNESLFMATQKLNGEIEKFLARGNRIEITDGGVLENLGGIALIKENPTNFQYFGAPRKYNEEDFLFQ